MINFAFRRAAPLIVGYVAYDGLYVFFGFEIDCMGMTMNIRKGWERLLDIAKVEQTAGIPDLSYATPVILHRCPE